MFFGPPNDESRSPRIEPPNTDTHEQVPLIPPGTYKDSPEGRDVEMHLRLHLLAKETEGTIPVGIGGFLVDQVLEEIALAPHHYYYSNRTQIIKAAVRLGARYGYLLEDKET